MFGPGQLVPYLLELHLLFIIHALNILYFVLQILKNGAKLKKLIAEVNLDIVDHDPKICNMHMKVINELKLCRRRRWLLERSKTLVDLQVVE